MNFEDDNFEPTLDDLEELENEFAPEPDMDAPMQELSPQSRQELALKMLRHVHENLGHAIELLESGQHEGASAHLADLLAEKSQMVREKEALMGRKVVEGVFDGMSMVGEDGNIYPVPPNYASKSRLIEGDVLKLTILEDGSLVYKQIRPMDRERAIGQLQYDHDQGAHLVLSEQACYQVLPASISFHRGEDGDEVVLTVPKGGQSKWAAVETIIKKR
jgi:hypothetical protein